LREAQASLENSDSSGKAQDPLDENIIEKPKRKHHHSHSSHHDLTQVKTILNKIKE
jgi:hypothetical protein